MSFFNIFEFGWGHPLAFDEETDAKIAAQIEADKDSAAEWNRRVSAGEVEDGELPF